MTKFSTDFKLNVVKFYLENNVSKHEIAKRFGVIKSEVIKWIALYENHGESGLRPRYTNYSQEFKIDVLNYMKENGTSFRETAAIFNISSDATIGKWLKIVETQGVDALQQMIIYKKITTPNLFTPLCFSFLLFYIYQIVPLKWLYTFSMIWQSKD